MVSIILYNSRKPDLWHQPKLWPTGGLVDLPLASYFGEGDTDLPHDSHPISQLIRSAHASFSTVLKYKSHSLKEAAAAYRARRGRHPPPGFGHWFKEAKKRKAIVVESFFDRIHHDTTPFWALDPLELRRQAHSAPQVIQVRGGKASFKTDNPDRPPFIQLWAALVEDMALYLPDLDMPVNIMDESRLLVPWEKIDKYVSVEGQLREKALFPPEEAEVEHTSYEELDAQPIVAAAPKWVTGEANRYWDHFKATCPPESPARKFSSLGRFDGPIGDLYPLSPGPYTYEGFVQNSTAARDACSQPHLRGMHGTFIESVSMSTSHDLLPMFGGCKLSRNNEMLLPGAMYLTDDPFYEGGADESVPWAQKKDALIWRGVASGGRNRADNWWHLHRHRFVQMLSGSVVKKIEAGDSAAAPTFQLPPHDTVYREIAGAKTPGSSIGRWLDTISNVSCEWYSCSIVAEFDISPFETRRHADTEWQSTTSNVFRWHATKKAGKQTWGALTRMISSLSRNRCR